MTIFTDFTTFGAWRRVGVPVALAVSALSLAACSGSSGSAEPTATVTVTAPPSPSDEPSPEASPASSPSPEPSSTSVFDDPADDDWPPISDKTPPIFGEVFQSDPGHDFTKGISPSRDGIVRGELRTMQDANVAEYVPIKFVKDPSSGQGRFEGPKEGDVMAFAAPIAKNVVFLSAVGCDGKDQTINNQYIGTQSCSRDKLISRAVKGGLYALITVKNHQIAKVVEIYAP
ncbi:hypothetical protein IMZ11_40515 [Microtetraspora sp. AC03309]|uniref:hypothetical protein n=1 Tax=Microtetraspora sp. AC03309 TaxID=2779376 RepID=UPI001E36208D|nr:hypothetical protein [Microtetraspora sp. AC03309]MCC5581904.1 hypothetical protein [Microtetraspora sp. AC03309]